MSEHRLIYADELIKVFEQYLNKMGYEGESISKSARTSLIKWVIDKTNEQPTAYDIDKVIKELEEDSQMAFYEMNEPGIYAGLQSAVETVKKGGAE